MALNPYHRKSAQKYQPGIDNPPKTSRVPWLVSAIGLIALLGIVYQLSVSGLSGTTAQLFSWSVQPPP